MIKYGKFKRNLSKVVSLGALCHTVHFFKSEGLKHGSYPFDWVFSSNDTVIRCLLDDFEAYLDKSYYIDSSLGLGDRCGHKLFAGSFFNHRDVRQDHHYVYIVRCVTRFRDVFASTETKIFLFGHYNLTRASYIVLPNLHKMFSSLSKKKTSNFKLIAVLHRTGEKRDQRILETNIEQMIVIEIVTVSSSNGLTFDDKEDNLFFNTSVKNLLVN